MTAPTSSDKINASTLPMIKTFNCKNPYKNLLKDLEYVEEKYVIIVGKNSNPKDVARYINKIFLVHNEARVVIVSSLKFAKKDNEQATKHANIAVIENLAKSFGKKGKCVNTIRHGWILENKHNTLNKLINQCNLKKEINISDPKNAYYYVSKKDIAEAIKNTLNTTNKGEVFDVSLNMLTIEDILDRLNNHYKLKLGFINNEKIDNKISINTEKNIHINFRPSVTVGDYIYKNKGNTSFTNVSKNNAKKSIPKKYLIGSLVMGLLSAVMLMLIDFGVDNYFLYKHLTNQDYENAITYSDKLRKRYLPTKYGENYKNVYNTIFYSLSTYQTVADKEGVKHKSMQTLGNKATEYAELVNRDLLITKKEKELYDRYIPAAKLISNNIKYTELLKIDNFLSKDHNILVLIQNSNEIRPTGGFIGSYALIKTENYTIKDYKFDDIYNVDGVLEKKYSELLVETPTMYKEFINSPFLYARDLNLILNGKQRNDAIIKYFEAATDESIDAVVYLNLDSAKRVLSVTGPLYLGTYGVEVNQENFDVLAQTYSEENYYEGSSQKKNFLKVLGARAINTIDSQETHSKADFLPELVQALENKEALIYIKEPTPNSVIEKLNLSENIVNPYPNGDYVYILENNLGENKVNKVSNKRAEYNITYDARRGLKLIDLRINIKNGAETYSWPYGDYKGYLHIAVPKDYYFAKALLQSPNKSKEVKEVDITKAVITSQEENTQILNIPFVTKPTEEVSILISLEDEDKNFAKKDYTLFIQKQPGAKPYNFTLNYNIPDISKESIDKSISKDTLINVKKPN